MSILSGMILWNMAYPWVPILLVILSFGLYLFLKFALKDPRAERGFFISIGITLGGWGLVLAGLSLTRMH